MTPTARQIACAWNGVKTEYGVRRNKGRPPGSQWEVYADLGPDAPIDDNVLKVLQTFPTVELAEKTADRLDDDARAKAVLRLFREKS